MVLEIDWVLNVFYSPSGTKPILVEAQNNKIDGTEKN
jgi:hypothetical protein